MKSLLHTEYRLPTLTSFIHHMMHVVA